MDIKECIRNVESVLRPLLEGNSELAKGMIHIDDGMASAMSKEDLNGLYESFKRAADEVHGAINYAMDVLMDYEDEDGNEPDIEEFLGYENLRKLSDSAEFIEALAVTLGNASSIAKN